MTESGELSFAFESAALTDIGRVRKVNEDAFLVLPDSGVWLVADGMGGHAAGDFASEAVVKEISTVGVPGGAVDLRARFMDRLNHANARILDHAAHLGNGTIGTTVAALLMQQGHYACIWSGDSRVYRMRGGVLKMTTRDHTEVSALLDAGSITAAEAEAWPRKNVITRAIGVTDEPECDMIEGRLADDDLFLLCSDGLTEYFRDNELERVIREKSDALDAMCKWLVQEAIDRGGRDNITVVAVRCRQTEPPDFEADGPYPELGGS